MKKLIFVAIITTLVVLIGVSFVHAMEKRTLETLIQYEKEVQESKILEIERLKLEREVLILLEKNYNLRKELMLGCCERIPKYKSETDGTLEGERKGGCG